MATTANPQIGRGLPPPSGFDGTKPELFEDFAFKLKSYLSLQEPNFSGIMDYAPRQTEPIIDDALVTQNAEGQLAADERQIRMSHTSNTPSYFSDLVRL